MLFSLLTLTLLLVLRVRNNSIISDMIGGCVIIRFISSIVIIGIITIVVVIVVMFTCMINMINNSITIFRMSIMIGVIVIVRMAN